MGAQQICGCSDDRTRDVSNEVDLLNMNDSYVHDFRSQNTFTSIHQTAQNFTNEYGLESEKSYLISRIIASKQEHLLKKVRKLEREERGKKIENEEYINTLEGIDFENVDSLYHNICKEPSPSVLYPDLEESEDKFDINAEAFEKSFLKLNSLDAETIREYYRIGLRVIAEKQVALIVMAEPSYIYEKDLLTENIGLLSQKSLLEIFFEKIEKVLDTAKRNFFDTVESQKCYDLVKIYILTNESNHKTIEKFLKYSKYISSRFAQPICFSQRCLPLVSPKGRILFKRNDEILFQPVGTGGIFKALDDKQKIFEKIKSHGCNFVNIVNLGNLLVKPLDPIHLGFTYKNNYDISCKALTSTSQSEDAKNIFLTKEGLFRVFAKNDRRRKESLNILGDLRRLENETIPLYTFPENFENIFIKVDFYERIVSNQNQLVYQELMNNYHLTTKTYTVMQDKANVEVKGFMFQLHIHDLFPKCQKFGALVVSEENEYAPIREFTFKEDIKTGIGKMEALHKKWLKTTAGKLKLDLNINSRLEISPLTSYEGENLDETVMKLYGTKADGDLTL